MVGEKYVAVCPHGETEVSLKQRWAVAAEAHGDVRRLAEAEMVIAACCCCGGPTQNSPTVDGVWCRRCQ